MRKIFYSVVILVFSSCQGTNTDNLNQNADNFKFPGDPALSEIVTSDIDLFWNAYDKQVQDTLSNVFQLEYLDKGSIGLKSIINTNRIESAKALKQLVLSEQAYYNNIRASSIKSKQFEKQIRATHYALKYLYPEAIFPPVYLTIGRTTGIGMDTANGLIITVETLSDVDFKTSYGRPSFDLDLLPFVVAHEIIHFLQSDDENNESLLKHCIREGSADFISEMTSGEKVKICNGPNVYGYGDKNEEMLWNEFKSEMHLTELSPWLYSQTIDGRPQNLGYWMGYKIVEAYYDKADNKMKAISDILNVKDYNKFLELSGYKTSK